jgi:predicted metal-dependent hydrolase
MVLKLPELMIQSFMNEISFKDLKILHICKPKIKHSYINIKVDTDGINIILKTPKVSASFIQTLLLEKELWIRKQLLKIAKRTQTQFNLEDEILIFGEIYSTDSNEAQDLREKLKKISTTNKTLIAKKYDEFYKDISKLYLSQRVQYFSNIMNLNYSELKFRKMKSRWGSCSSKKVITLNTQLIKIKKELIDYVIVHELAHLVHMNHSKQFHNLVEFYIHNSKQRRQELKTIYLEK